MKKITALTVALSLLTSAAFAQAPAENAAGKYTLDAAHTQVMFQTEHMGISHPWGNFVTTSGSYTFDPAKVEASNVDVTIDTTSLDMNNEAWNKHMKSADLFNVEKYPTITFKSTKAEKTGEKTGKLTGDMTLLGVTKPVTLDVLYVGSTVNPMSKKFMTGFTASTKIKRSDFGMKYGIPMVSDEANITINVEGVREGVAPGGNQ